MKKKVVKTISLVLTFSTLIVCTFCFVGCIEWQGKEDKEVNVEPMALDLEFQQVSSHIMLASEPRNGATSGSEVTLTATVLPSDAPNKQVDWSVSWGQNATLSSQTVTNYITVTPSSDGSTTATVTCKKGFGDDVIVVTVTTRSGGYKAYCNCTFTGVPTSIVITATGCSTKTVSGWNKTMLSANSGTTYTFPLSLTNQYNSVNSQYGTFSFSLTGHGGVKSKHVIRDTDGNITSTDIREDLLEAAPKSANGSQYTHIAALGTIFTVLYVKIEENNLVVKASAVPNSYGYTYGARTGSDTVTFDSYIDGKIPYTTITVTETVSGITQSIDVVTAAVTNGISISHNSIAF